MTGYVKYVLVYNMHSSCSLFINNTCNKSMSFFSAKECST